MPSGLSDGSIKKWRRLSRNIYGFRKDFNDDAWQSQKQTRIKEKQLLLSEGGARLYNGDGPSLRRHIRIQCPFRQSCCRVLFESSLNPHGMLAFGETMWIAQCRPSPPDRSNLVSSAVCGGNRKCVAAVGSSLACEMGIQAWRHS